MIVLYLPWLPTLLYQSKHTAAPWAITPSFHALLLAPGAVLSGDAPFMAIVLAGGVGLATVVRRRGDPARRPVLALAAVVGVTVLARVARVAGLAGVDDPVLRGRRRAAARDLGGRPRARRPARPRRARRSCA